MTPQLFKIDRGSSIKPSKTSKGAWIEAPLSQPKKLQLQLDSRLSNVVSARFITKKIIIIDPFRLLCYWNLGKIPTTYEITKKLEHQELEGKITQLQWENL
jgi:hypothetical protein